MKYATKFLSFSAKVALVSYYDLSLTYSSLYFAHCRFVKAKTVIYRHVAHVQYEIYDTHQCRESCVGLAR